MIGGGSLPDNGIPLSFDRLCWTKDNLLKLLDGERTAQLYDPVEKRYTRSLCGVPLAPSNAAAAE